MINCNYCTLSNKCPGFDNCPHLKGDYINSKSTDALSREEYINDSLNRIEIDCMRYGQELRAFSRSAIFIELSRMFDVGKSIGKKSLMEIIQQLCH